MKNWLIQIEHTDDATYSFYETVAVCTNEISVIEMEEKAKVLYPEYPVFIKEVETDTLF